MKVSITDILVGQRKPMEPVVQVDLTGKTVVLVGANTGLGFEACKHFARMNPAPLVMACRSHQRGEEAIAELKEATGYKNAELSLVDLGKYSSVKEFCARWEGRLDILVMNAGIAVGKYNDMEGWESTIKVNHLGTALATLLLLPHLKATAQQYNVVPRVVVVSSDVHYLTSIPEQLIDNHSQPILKKLGSEDYCTAKVMQERYPQSKLLNVFFVRALTEHLKKELHPVVVNLVNPGYCYSGLRRDASLLQLAMFWVTDVLFAYTTEEGSRNLVFAAVGSAGNEESLKGEFIFFNETREVSDFVLGKSGITCQERLWNETIDILSAEEPKIRDIANGQF